MKKIFQPADFESPDLAKFYDELPAWSAPFGKELLDAVNFSKPVNALDIGCGTGYPLIELAQRFGETSHFTGIDPWETGLSRIKAKLRFFEIKNVSLLNAKAEMMPMSDQQFDLIVSNNGLNNVDYPEKAFKECYRVAKPGASLIFTANLPGTMAYFYNAFNLVINETGNNYLIEAVENHIRNKRKSVAETLEIVSRSGFTINSTVNHAFSMKFHNGTAFFNHSLIRLYFLNSWKMILPEALRDDVIDRTETKLNQQAISEGGLNMEIPFCIYKASRPF